MDILGGADLFRGKDRRRAAAFISQLSEFERRLNGYSPHFPGKRHSDALVKTFSDSVFVAFPLRSNKKLSDELTIRVLLDELRRQIFWFTLFAGLPVRGAVTVGSLMFTDKVLFGPALVEAVELEKQAVFPRVLVSPKLLAMLGSIESQSSHLLKDSDGQVFIDYLSDPFHGAAFFKIHRDYVTKGLREHSSKVRVRQKYEWLARFHNHASRISGLAELEIQYDAHVPFHPWGQTSTTGVAPRVSGSDDGFDTVNSRIPRFVP